MRKLILAGLITLLTAPASPAQLSGQVYFWQLSPEGNATVGDSGIPGTRIDIEDDLGLDDEDIVGFRAALGDSHRFLFDYFTFDTDARNQIERSILYGGERFNVSEAVTSELDSDFLRLMYAYNLGHDQVQGGIMAGVQILSIEGSLSSPRVGTETADIETGSPVVGGFLSVRPIPQLELYAELLGMSWDFGDVEATFYDLHLSAQLHIDPLVGGVGYRLVAVDAEDSDEFIEADLEFGGPILFAGFSF